MYEQLNIFSLMQPEPETDKPEKFHPIEEYIKHGSGTEDSRWRISDFFESNQNISERAEFLKEEYGTGGFSRCTSKPFVVYRGRSDSKGCEIEFYDGNMEVNKLKISYSGLAKAIGKMIKEGRF